MRTTQIDTAEQERYDAALEYVNARVTGTLESANMLAKMRQHSIPDYMCEGLLMYLSDGVPVGDFLTALLSNDLSKAVARADRENQNALAGYVIFLFNNAPRIAWGSEENVTQWIAAGVRRRQRASA